MTKSILYEDIFFDRKIELQIICRKNITLYKFMFKHFFLHKFSVFPEKEIYVLKCNISSI